MAIRTIFSPFTWMPPYKAIIIKNKISSVSLTFQKLLLLGISTIFFLIIFSYIRHQHTSIFSGCWKIDLLKHCKVKLAYRLFLFYHQNNNKKSLAWSQWTHRWIILSSNDEVKRCYILNWCMYRECDEEEEAATACVSSNNSSHHQSDHLNHCLVSLSPQPSSTIISDHQRLHTKVDYEWCYYELRNDTLGVEFQRP